MPDSRAARPGHAEGDDLAYLLVQLGFHVARRFSEQLAPLDLEPRQFGMLTRLAANEGRSQQAIGELVGLNPTRMVFLVDDLEQRGLVERRRNPADRRSHALYLTELGRAKLREAQQASAGPQGEIGASLTERQRGELTRLLRRLADEQGIPEEGLPGPPPGIG
jgi:DNA-binding MarR family transcriptional regulator